MSRVLMNVAFVAGGVLFAQSLGGLRSLFLAKLIDPGDYGIWTTAQLTVTLAPIACLGTVETLLKQVPYFRGKNDLTALKKVESAVLGTIVISSVLVSLSFFAGDRLLP